MRPVTPQPGYTSGDVHTLIATGQFVYADCYTFYLPNGDGFRYTSAQHAVKVVPLDGSFIFAISYLADDIRVSGLKMRLKIGVDVDEQEMKIAYTKFNTIYNETWGAAVAGGILDGAIIRRDRYFAAEWGIGSIPTAWVGGAPMFVGRTSSISDMGRQEITVKVKSYMVLANISMPKELHQPSCRNTLFDARCSLVKSAFGVNGTAGAGSDNGKLNWAGALSTFALGTVSMVSGPSAGQTANIQSANGTSLTLSYPLPFEPDPGDSFIAYSGCNRSIANCTALGNDPELRHTGFPYVPPPMTAV